MRNMIQLLGGVVVAGVVAASSAAFTAPGVADNTATGGKVLAGGISADVTITGASLDGMILASNVAGEYTKVTLNLSTDDGDNDPITGGTVKLLITGTSTDAADVTPNYLGCSHVGTPDGKWECTPAGSLTAITGLKVSVSAPTI